MKTLKTFLCVSGAVLVALFVWQWLNQPSELDEYHAAQAACGKFWEGYMGCNKSSQTLGLDLQAQGINPDLSYDGHIIPWTAEDAAKQSKKWADAAADTAAFMKQVCNTDAYRSHPDCVKYITPGAPGVTYGSGLSDPKP